MGQRRQGGVTQGLGVGWGFLERISVYWCQRLQAGAVRLHGPSEAPKGIHNGHPTNADNAQQAAQPPCLGGPQALFAVKKAAPVMVACALEPGRYRVFAFTVAGTRTSAHHPKCVPVPAPRSRMPAMT